MGEKILTIIVPIYNKETLLEQCLRSLCIKQNMSSLEVLMVDDGSTDSSYQIMDKYAERYPDIFIAIKKENGGVGSVMDIGLCKATGIYIKEVDADDWVDTKALQNLVNTLLLCRADIVLNPFREVDENGNKIHEIYFKGFYFYKMYPIEKVIGKVLFSIQDMTIRKDILTQNKFSVSKDRYYIDMQLVDSSVLYAKDIYILSDSLYRYRKNQEEQSVSISSYIKNISSFENQTYLSLERLRNIRNSNIKTKESYFINNAIGYSIYLSALYWFNVDFGRMKWKKYDKYLFDEFPDVYQALNKVAFINKLRKYKYIQEKKYRDYLYWKLKKVNKGNSGIEIVRKI